MKRGEFTLFATRTYSRRMGSVLVSGDQRDRVDARVEVGASHCRSLCHRPRTGLALARREGGTRQLNPPSSSTGCLPRFLLRRYSRGSVSVSCGRCWELEPQLLLGGGVNGRSFASGWSRPTARRRPLRRDELRKTWVSGVVQQRPTPARW